MKVKIQSILYLVFSCFLLTVYASSKSDLEREIEQADANFFNAFNACDIDTMATMFSEELEFYHDTAGVGDYQSNLAATQQLCERNLGLERTLVAGSLEVYPIKNFGALQKGQHRFCHMVNGKKDCGTFGFMHIWKQEGTRWVMHRVISYGH